MASGISLFGAAVILSPHFQTSVLLCKSPKDTNFKKSWKSTGYQNITLSSGSRFLPHDRTYGMFAENVFPISFEGKAMGQLPYPIHLLECHIVMLQNCIHAKLKP